MSGGRSSRTGEYQCASDLLVGLVAMRYGVLELMAVMEGDIPDAAKEDFTAEVPTVGPTFGEVAKSAASISWPSNVSWLRTSSRRSSPACAGSVKTTEKPL